jgi:hypothetical protein
MRKLPWTVVVVGSLFVIAGVAGIIYHLPEWRASSGPPSREIWAVAIRLLAIICGVFLFLGKNWARWLAILWMAYHVGLSAFHSLSQTVTHVVLLAVITVLLYLPMSRRYFERASTP